MRDAAKVPSTPIQFYRAHRYQSLCDLERVRAMGRIGTASPQVCARERKSIISAHTRERVTVNLRGNLKS